MAQTLRSWLRAWTPYSPGNMIYWGKAGIGQLNKDGNPASDADGVGRWVDQSGQGNDLLAASDDFSPVLNSGAGGEFNGWPFLDFDGKNDYLQAEMKGAVQPFFIFMVFQRTGDKGDQVIFDGGLHVDGTFGYMLLTNDSSSGEDQFVTYDVNASDNFTLTKEQNYLGEFLFDGINSYVYINGIFAADASSLGNDPSNGFTLGNVSEPAYDYYSYIRVAEVLIYAKATLSNADKINIRSYLNNKFNIY